jgi:molecular chaperone IbpA
MSFAKSGLLGFGNEQMFGDRGFPKFNILMNEKGDVTIVQFALAGYRKEDLKIELENGVLHLSGQNSNMNKNRTENNKFREVHKGIASRVFSQSWVLPKHAKINNCEFQDGILTIWIAVEVPEELKPKIIIIN